MSSAAQINIEEVAFKNKFDLAIPGSSGTLESPPFELRIAVDNSTGRGKVIRKRALRTRRKLEARQKRTIKNRERRKGQVKAKAQIQVSIENFVGPSLPLEFGPPVLEIFGPFAPKALLEQRDQDDFTALLAGVMAFANPAQEDKLAEESSVSLFVGPLPAPAAPAEDIKIETERFFYSHKGRKRIVSSEDYPLDDGQWILLDSEFQTQFFDTKTEARKALNALMRTTGMNYVAGLQFETRIFTLHGYEYKMYSMVGKMGVYCNERPHDDKDKCEAQTSYLYGEVVPEVTTAYMAAFKQQMALRFEQLNPAKTWMDYPLTRMSLLFYAMLWCALTIFSPS